MRTETKYLKLLGEHSRPQVRGHFIVFIRLLLWALPSFLLTRKKQGQKTLSSDFPSTRRRN